MRDSFFFFLAIWLFLTGSAEALDSVLIIHGNLKYQGVIYEYRDHCYLLTTKSVNKVEINSLYSRFEIDLMSSGQRRYEKSGSVGIALFEILPRSYSCDSEWPKTIDSKRALHSDPHNEVVSIVHRDQSGSEKKYSGEIRFVGKEFFCVSSSAYKLERSPGGALVTLQDIPIGIILKFGKCPEGGGIGFVSQRIDTIEKELRSSQLLSKSHEYAKRIEYKNGLYSGPINNDKPDGKGGVFTFTIGDDSYRGFSSESWQLKGKFKNGYPDGTVSLIGPIAEDKKEQECQLHFKKGRVRSGTCDIYFNIYESRMGVDPRIVNSVEQRGFRNYKDLLKSGEIKCLNSACTEYYGGYASFIGRYKGAVKGGKKSFFEESVSGYMTEDYLVLHGRGTFEDHGRATFCFVNCDHVNPRGPNFYIGGWLDGSLTGQAKIIMNHGGVLEGRFDLNILEDGRASKATANMIGMAYNMGYSIYTGPIKKGYEHGKNGRRTSRIDNEKIEGEFRWGLPWNADHWWERNGEKRYCKWVNNKCTQKR